MTENEQRPWLVTGAAGFLGSHVVEELLGRGLPVVALDDLQWGRLEFLAPSLKKPGCTLVVADLRDATAVKNLLDRFRPANVDSPGGPALYSGLHRRPGPGHRHQRAGHAVAAVGVPGRRNRAVLVRLHRRRLCAVRSHPTARMRIAAPFNIYGLSKSQGEQLVGLAVARATRRSTSPSAGCSTCTARARPTRTSCPN